MLPPRSEHRAATGAGAHQQSPGARCGAADRRTSVAANGIRISRRRTIDEFVRRAFYVLLGIRANDDEVRASMNALTAWRKLPNAASRCERSIAPGQHLVWALLNHNDFVTVR